MSEQANNSTPGLSVANKLSKEQIDQIYDTESNPIDEIKARVAKQSKSQSGIGIGRIPIEAKEEFMDLAESKFADDYGMALAFLVDYFKTTEAENELYRRLNKKIDDLHEEVTQ